jgi:peroxiredoxin Q/BCP
MKLKRILVFIAAAFIASTAAAAPQVGDLAPDFTLPGTDGNSYTLSQLRGKHVVIAFFPKAYTSG